MMVFSHLHMHAKILVREKYFSTIFSNLRKTRKWPRSFVNILRHVPAGMFQVYIPVHSLHFNGHFPGGPGFDTTRMSPFWMLLELRMMEVVVTTGAIRHAQLQSNCHLQQTNTSFLQAGYPSCRPTNYVRVLKEKLYTHYMTSTQYMGSHNYQTPQHQMTKCRQTSTDFHIFFTVKFRKNLQRNVNVKLPPPLKSVAALPCETQWSAIQQYIHISDNNMLHVRKYLFHEFFFIYSS